MTQRVWGCQASPIRGNVLPFNHGSNVHDLQASRSSGMGPCMDYFPSFVLCEGPHCHPLTHEALAWNVHYLRNRLPAV